MLCMSPNRGVPLPAAGQLVVDDRQVGLAHLLQAMGHGVEGDRLEGPRRAGAAQEVIGLARPLPLDGREGHVAGQGRVARPILDQRTQRPQGVVRPRRPPAAAGPRRPAFRSPAGPTATAAAGSRAVPAASRSLHCSGGTATANASSGSPSKATSSEAGRSKWTSEVCARPAEPGQEIRLGVAHGRGRLGHGLGHDRRRPAGP